MRNFPLFLLPLLLAIGCARQSTPTLASANQDQDSTVNITLEPEAYATLRGRVVYDGAPRPDGRIMEQVQANDDRDHCLQDKNDYADPTWQVDESGGVANVAIWVRPPKGKHFGPIPPERKTWKHEIVIDTPYCAFVPRVSVAFPSYFDGQRLVDTGQKIFYTNSAPIAHNLSIQGQHY